MLDKFRTQKIIWDKANNEIFEKVEAHSGDSNGRKLTVQVLNNGMIESLTDCTLSLAWQTKDKAHYGLDAFTAVDIEHGIFEIYYTRGMLSNVGELRASFVLMDSKCRIESKGFTIEVLKSNVDDDAVQSDNSFTALTEALIKVSKYQDEIDNIKADIINQVDTLISTEQEKLDNLYTEKESKLDTLHQDKLDVLNNLHDTEKAELDALEQDYADRATNLETTYAPRLIDVETEIQQARVNADNTVTYDTLKDRLDTEHTEVKSQLAEIPNYLSNRGIDVLNPPPPLVSCFGNGEDETDNFNAIVQFARDNNRDILIPETTMGYRLSKFNGLDNVNVIGIGKPRIDLYDKEGVSILPLLSFGNNAVYENLHFNCLETDLSWNRGELANRSNVILRNCKIEGFRNPTNNNSWGLYLDKTKDVLIENCEFENNTQSDIAIVEGCENINIVNPKGTDLHINFEPNNYTFPIKNINISCSNIKRLSCIEPLFTGNAIQGINIDSCTVELLYYKGGDITFTNSKINEVSSLSGGSGLIKINDSMLLGKNLIIDPFLYDLSKTGANGSFWKPLFIAETGLFLREKLDGGEVLTMNPSHISTSILLETRKISVKPNKAYSISILSSAEYPASGSNFISNQLIVRFYNVETLLSEKIISINRSEAGTTTPFNEETSLFVTPANTTDIIVRVGNVKNDTVSTASISIGKITLKEVFYKKGRNTNDTDHITYVTEAPSSDMASDGKNVWLKGTILYNANPIAGSYLGWVCTESGDPGVWNGFGLIET